MARSLIPLSMVLLWAVPAGAQSAETSAAAAPHVGAGVEVISHASERRAGWWIFGVMSTLGVTATSIGLAQTCVDDQTCQQWTSLAIWSGIAVTAAGALIGLPKIATSDETTLTLLPGALPLSDPTGAQLSDRARSSAFLSGLTLSGRF